MQIQNIFRDGFGGEQDWHQEKIRQRLNNASVVGLLEAPGTPPAGYAIYSSPDEALDGRFVLWEDGVCLRRTWQRKGIAPKPQELVRGLSELLDRKFGWLGGDTQNPLVYKRYASLGRVFPIDMPFTSKPGQRLLNFLLDHVPQVKSRRKDLNIRSGALTKIYKEGRLGQYEVGISGAEPFEEYLMQHGVRRERGDALLLVAEFRE
jgi:hypothetical protein